MRPMFTKAGIIGTGLIGGSISLALKNNGLCRHLTGIARSEETRRRAKIMGAVDQASGDIAALSEAEIVILAVPVSDIIEVSLELARHIGPDTIVFDVASTKKNICRVLSRRFRNFVGCHPIAGSEQCGIANADATLFSGAVCVITPTTATSGKALRTVSKLWRALGSKVIMCSPAEHDKAFAATSHLPHAVSFALMNSLRGDYFRWTAPSLNEMTRIAASPSAVWLPIFTENKANILRAISDFERSLAVLKRAIAKNDSRTITSFIDSSRKKRERIVNSHSKQKDRS